MTQEILQLMENRRFKIKYKQLNKDFEEDVEKPRRNTGIQSVKRSKNYQKSTIFFKSV